MALMEFSCAKAEQKKSHLSQQNVLETLKQISKTNLAAVSDSKIDKRESLEKNSIDFAIAKSHSPTSRKRVISHSHSSSDIASLRISSDEFCSEIVEIQEGDGEIVKYFIKGEPFHATTNVPVQKRFSPNQTTLKRRSSTSEITHLLQNSREVPDENQFAANENLTNIRTSASITSNGKYQDRPFPKSSSASSLPVSSSRQTLLHDQSFASLTLPQSATRRFSSKENSLVRTKQKSKLSVTATDQMKNPEKQIKQLARKKRRSSSWYTMLLSSSYKQKNDLFHKHFKQLPESERLLVDCTCALMKDILVQGRMYISQNYVCFHSNILSWQTTLVVQFKDVEQITKERTVKVIPNAIQFQTKGKGKAFTFTSFTQRDKTFKQVYKLWQNALTEKPMTPHEFWSNVHSNYGAELGCSSDEDYVKPEDGIATSSKVKGKKKHKNTRQDACNLSISDVSQQEESKSTQMDQYSEESKSSCPEIDLICSEEKEKQLDQDAVEDNEPCEHAKEALRREYLLKEYPVSAEDLFQILFDDKCGFTKAFQEGKGCYNVAIEKWREGGDDYEGNQIRNISFKMPLSNLLVPKSSHFEELQIINKESEPGYRYSVDGIARSFGAPYSEYFSSIMRYNIRKLTRTTCELHVTAEMKYHKTPWGLVKNFIEKNVNGGTEENFQLLDRHLSSYLSHRHRPRTLSVRRVTQTSNSLSQHVSSTSVTTNADTKTSSSDPPTTEPSVNVLPTQTSKSTHLNFPSTNYEKQYQHKVEITNGKWLFRLLCMIFILLLWSNYAMYHRIATLEQVHSHYAKDEISIDSFTDYDVTNPYSDASSKALHLLDRRLFKVESLVRNLTTASERRWLTVSHEWQELRKAMTKLLNQFDADK